MLFAAELSGRAGLLGGWRGWVKGAGVARADSTGGASPPQNASTLPQPREDPHWRRTLEERGSEVELLLMALSWR
uniref:Uncharacterized protein n=1 Tax=Arundo donax TaxID=35708 RepID=A0A0A9U2J1_ARUDO